VERWAENKSISIMEKKIKQEFDALEKSRFELFKKLDKLDGSKMNNQPDPKSWSVVQVMDHLTLAERNSLLYMKKKLSVTNEFRKSNFKTTFRMFLLKSALKLPIKWRAPKIVADAKNEKTYDEAKAAWTEVRNGIAEFLENFPAEHLDSELFKHPSAGKFTVVQALNFMHTHFEHHLKQFDRITKAVH
jgi:hypothetical protein